MVRVLAIAKTLLEVELEEEFLIEACLLAHVSSYATVVLSSMGVCLSRELQASFESGVASSVDLSEDSVVVRRIANDSHIVVVLRCRAQHRWATYINLLDGFCHSSTLFGDGLAEWIEVHAHEVDELDTVLLQCLEVRWLIAASEKTAVHLWVKGLNATVADLWETRYIADTDSFNT